VHAADWEVGGVLVQVQYCEVHDQDRDHDCRLDNYFTIAGYNYLNSLSKYNYRTYMLYQPFTITITIKYKC